MSSAEWVLTTGVIKKHNVVQGNVALSLLGDGCFKDNLWKQQINKLNHYRPLHLEWQTDRQVENWGDEVEKLLNNRTAQT